MWITPERRGMRHWIVPGFVALVGVALAIVLMVRDRADSALAALAVLAGYALLLAYRAGERAFAVSDAFGGGRRADLRLRAAAMTGDVLVAAIVGALVVQALRDAAVGPLAWLAALAGVTYVVSLLLVDSGP
ncbi:MAG TPA: ABC transporter permease [Streptosporangiaceae bacterium]|nr:ABC transporter permease [Streptosporangiaceae bacterium]